MHQSKIQIWDCFTCCELHNDIWNTKLLAKQDVTDNRFECMSGSRAEWRSINVSTVRRRQQTNYGCKHDATREPTLKAFCLLCQFRSCRATISVAFFLFALSRWIFRELQPELSKFKIMAPLTLCQIFFLVCVIIASNADWFFCRPDIFCNASPSLCSRPDE